MWSDRTHEWIVLQCCDVNQSTRLLGLFSGAAHASAQWWSVTDVVFTVQSRADCWERAAKVSAGYLCVWWCTPLTVLSISRPGLRGPRVTAWLSMFGAFKCLCLRLMRRCWGAFKNPLFCPLISKQDKKILKERGRKEGERRGVREGERTLCFKFNS